MLTSCGLPSFYSENSFPNFDLKMVESKMLIFIKIISLCGENVVKM